MAGSSAPSCSFLFSIGNCEVEIEGNEVVPELSSKDLLISVLGAAKIKISVHSPKKRWTKKSRKDFLSRLLSEESSKGEEVFSMVDYSFILVNPKDNTDNLCRLLLQEVLKLYKRELPTMIYAANTRKKSLFLEKCVSSGKYRTLLLKSNAIEGCAEVVAAISFQIIPTDTRYAEIPLAVVSQNYQRKGIGGFLFMELRKRLQNIGVLTIFCWGDKDSESFWLKQGFVSIAEFDSSGRARRLPIKADIRKALCFPGDSTLMVSHLNMCTSTVANHSKQVELFGPSKFSAGSTSLVSIKASGIMETRNCYDIPKIHSVKEDVPTADRTRNLQPRSLSEAGLAMDEMKANDSSNVLDYKQASPDLGVTQTRYDADGCYCSGSGQGGKRKVWEASRSSLKSKRIKGDHHNDCHLDSCPNHVDGNRCKHNLDIGDCSLKDKSLVKVIPKDAQKLCCLEVNHEENMPLQNMSINDRMSVESSLKREHPVIMLMNIADDSKKTWLTKIVDDFGGSITSNGCSSTHVITGKARRTLNLCTALSSGAWVVTPDWLKASFRDGKFVGESSYILKDDDYEQKYKTELKDAILRAKRKPHGLLKGYNICLSNHVQPPANILMTIVKSAGGKVLGKLGNASDPLRTIFIACEEEMEAALEAAKRGIWTYNSEWFMSCIMRQELDFDAQQFAESL